MEDAGSIPAGLPFPDRDLPQWRRIRAEMPLPGLVAEAGRLRAAGDWRAAAALLPAAIDVDLPKVRDRFGAEATAALEDDLRHLCLDLLWWHLPRHQGGMSTLQARVSAVLAPPSGADTAPLVRIRLPRSPVGPQRVLVEVASYEELRYERWYLAPRYTWDVREAGHLHAVWMRPRLYAQLSAGDFEAAWRDCGIALNFSDLSALQRPTAAPTSPSGVAEQARAAAEAFGVDRVSTIFGAYLTLKMPELSADASDPGDWAEVPVRIPAGPVPPDLALIAAGLLSPSGLHPLMRSALFPEATGGTAVPASPQDSGYFRAKCRGQWHRLSITGGALRLHDHDEAEQRREAALRALGGTSGGCYAIQSAWRTGEGRLPRALREHRRAVVERLQHGDTEYLLRGLADGTLDPHMRDARGWSLLHMAMWLDHERALPPLLAAGLPVDARDRIERTPLYVGVMNGADPDLLRRLLAEGADPLAATVHGATPKGVAGSRGDWRDLRFIAYL